MSSITGLISKCKPIKICDTFLLHVIYVAQRSSPTFARKIATEVFIVYALVMKPALLVLT